jgi:hypothetical protein
MKHELTTEERGNYESYGKCSAYVDQEIRCSSVLIRELACAVALGGLPY